MTAAASANPAARGLEGRRIHGREFPSPALILCTTAAVYDPVSMLVPRRQLLACAAAASLAAPAAARADGVGTPITFTVLRDSSPIGTHRVTFARTGGAIAVEIAIDLEVRLLKIPVYRYTHRSAELWENGRLVRLDARTSDDGRRTEVRARASAAGLVVEGSGGSFLAPPATEPTSYWHEDMTRRAQLLDTQNGTLISVNARKTGMRRSRIAGRDIDVRFYELSGDLTSRLGYSAAGEWVDLEFDARGSRISYRRDAPPANVTLSPSGARSAS